MGKKTEPPMGKKPASEERISPRRMNALERIDAEELARQRRSPARGLTVSQRRTIGRWAEAHPTWSTSDIAERYSVSYSQARRAIDEYKSGALGAPRRRQPRKRVDDLVREKSAETLLMEQFHVCIAQLVADKDQQMPARIALLEKLTSMRRTMQRMELEAHMKRADAGIIALIVRRYHPDATDDDVIKIYHEASQAYKLSIE